MKKSILNIFLTLSVVMGLSSCLKDDPNFDASKSPKVVGFKNVNGIASPTSSSIPLFEVAFDILPEVEFDVPIAYSGTGNAPNDITMDVQVSEAAVTAYNEEHEEAFTVMPSSVYTIESNTVVIKKGERVGYLKVKFNTEQFDLNEELALGLTIVSSSSASISQNYKSAIYRVSPKNTWDGVYEVTGSYTDLANAAFSGIYPYTKMYLITTSANQVYAYNAEYGLNGFVFYTGTGLSYYGNWTPEFKIEGENVVDVTNAFGQGAGNRAGRLEASGVNTFKEVDGTLVMEVKYVMVQSGSDRCVFTETWKKVGVRP